MVRSVAVSIQIGSLTAEVLTTEHVGITAKPIIDIIERGEATSPRSNRCWASYIIYTRSKGALKASLPPHHPYVCRYKIAQS